MQLPLESVPLPIRRILENEEIYLAVGTAWVLGPSLGFLGGFYAGTIFGSPHVIDLQLKDMHNGLSGGLVGLVVGLLLAVVVTAVYPQACLGEQEQNVREGHPELDLETQEVEDFELGENAAHP